MKKLGLVIVLILTLIVAVIPYRKGIHDYLITETFNETLEVYEVLEDRISEGPFFSIYGKRNLFAGDYWYGMMQLDRYPIYNENNTYVYLHSKGYTHIMWAGTGHYDFRNHPSELIQRYPYNQYDLYISSDQVLILFVKHYDSADDWQLHVFTSTDDTNIINDHLAKLK